MFEGDKGQADEGKKRAIGVNVTPWPKSASGELIIPYVIESSSKILLRFMQIIVYCDVLFVTVGEYDIQN